MRTAKEAKEQLFKKLDELIEKEIDSAINDKIPRNFFTTSILFTPDFISELKEKGFFFSADKEGKVKISWD